MLELSLFGGMTSFDFFEKKKSTLKEEIGALSDSELQSSDDSLKIILKAKYNVQPIQLGKEKNRIFKREITNGYRKGKQIAINIEYLGDKDLFNLQPSHYYMYPIPAYATDNEVSFTVNVFSLVDTAQKVEHQINEKISMIKDSVNWLNDDIRRYNDSINSIIETELIQRRKRLHADEEIFRLLKVQQPTATEFVKPARKIEPKILENVERQIDPSLEMETYNQIISIINSFGISLERSCQILRDMDEIPLRDAILSALDTHFNGMVSGETYNKEGKVDILLRYKDKNIFIAECKIWSTEDVFNKGITQLLSYLTWRDTKTSYIIFSKNVDVNNVILNARRLAEANPNFITKIREVSNSCTMYKFKVNAETTIECYLTLHVFDLGSQS